MFPHTGWFKTTEMYSHGLEARNSTVGALGQHKVLAGPTLWRPEGRICSLTLPASGCCRHRLTVATTPVPVAFSLCLSVVGTFLTGFRTHPDNPA